MTGHRPIIFSLVVFLLLFIPGFLTADEAKGASAPFIDLDGDGLDDGAPDDDGDGIFNIAEGRSKPVPGETSPALTGLASFETSAADFSADFTPNSGKFSQLNRSCRIISTHRGGFGSGDQFGPGNGIGIGAVSSGGCAGGVCH